MWYTCVCVWRGGSVSHGAPGALTFVYQNLHICLLGCASVAPISAIKPTWACAGLSDNVAMHTCIKPSRLLRVISDKQLVFALLAPLSCWLRYRRAPKSCECMLAKDCERNSWFVHAASNLSRNRCACTCPSRSDASLCSLCTS